MSLDLKLPERFNEPGERDMAEMKLYADRLNDEVQRVRRVCDYFVRNKLLKSQAKPRMRVVAGK